MSRFLTKKAVFGYVNGQKIRSPFTNLSLAIRWPCKKYEKEEIKKDLNCCFYDSAVHFEFSGIKFNKIILFFSFWK